MNCKKTWTYFHGSCYKYFSLLHIDIQGEELFKSCNAQQAKATPVSILNKDENEFLRGKLLKNAKDSMFWIGFTSRNRENWGWSDGSVGKYTNWMRGTKLKDSKKKCGIMWARTGKWDSRPCKGFRANFICKYIPRGTSLVLLSLNLLYGGCYMPVRAWIRIICSCVQVDIIFKTAFPFDLAQFWHDS